MSPRIITFGNGLTVPHRKCKFLSNRWPIVRKYLVRWQANGHNLNQTAQAATSMYFRLSHWLAILTSCKAYDFYQNESFATAANAAAHLDDDHIEHWLDVPLMHLPQIVLLLHYNNVRQDIVNPYVKWFLHNERIPITLLSYDETELSSNIGDAVLRNKRNSYAIATKAQHIAVVAQVFPHKIGRFFYILHEPPNLRELCDIFHGIWEQKKILNNYLLTIDGVYIYDPFAYDATIQRYGQIVRFMGDRTLERQLFADMRGYPLRVQLFRSVYARPILYKGTRKVERVEGVDGRVATLLQEHMNFTMDWQEPDPYYFGERTPNGTYNGVIGTIVKDELDLCLTGFFVKDYMVPQMVFSVAVYDDQLCIYVPKAQRIPQSILPIYSVSMDLWLGFIMAGFLCAVVWCIFRRFNIILHLRRKSPDMSIIRSKLSKQFMRICIDTWVVWVRVNILKYPPFHAERIFIASLCLVSVIFGAIFESSLATVYINPLYYKDINTLAELDKSGLKIIYKYSSMADDLFYNETSPLFANLNKKLVHLQNLNADVTMDVAKHRGKASVSRYTSLNLESLHFIKSKKIWIVPECPKYYTISYVMPKDSPWEETVNGLLLEFLNAGLFVKWIKDMQTAVDIRIGTNKMFQSGDDGSFKILTINDLQLAFYIVMLGNILAGLCFLMEKYLGHMVPIMGKCFHLSTS